MFFKISGSQTMRVLFSASILFSFLLLPVGLFGQTTGTILGQVTDPSGAAVPSATVIATNTGTGLMRRGVVNAQGSYIMPALPIGTYKLTVRAPGFKKFTQTGITLQVGQNARVDVLLQLGAVNQTVQVSAAALSVDTHSTTVGEIVDNRRVQSIPLNGRNVLSLIQLLPGVGEFSPRTAVTFNRSGPSFTVSGSRESQNNVELDGATIVSGMSNVAQNLPSPDSLQEFEVLTNSYSARYGRASGGIVLAVTKSGTNHVHGGLWEFLRNDALNSRNYFNPAPSPQPFLRQNQFGGDIGGPVVVPHLYNGRDKTFFFFSYQGLRIRQQYDNVSTPPTTAELNGDFSATSSPIIDPLTGVQFPGNIIPTDRLDPLAVTMANKYLPVNPSTGTYQQLVSQPTNSNQVSFKLDEKLSPTDSAWFRYYRDKDISLNTAGGNSIPLMGSQSNTVTSYAFSETHVFKPTLLNEAEFSYSKPYTVFATSPNNLTPTDLGAQFAQDGPIPLAPNVSVHGFFSISPEFPLPESDGELEVSDNLSWIKGRHSLELGGFYMHIHHLSTGQFNSSGAFTFDGSFTGNSLADYMIGRPITLFQQSPLHDESTSSDYQFYAQDDFKVTRRLTLNLGLRYEIDTPPVQVLNNTSSIRPYVGCSLQTCEQSTKFPTAPPGLVFPGDQGVPRGIIPADKKDFGPRVGLAWDPFGNGRTSIRAGAGMFYDYTGANISATVNQTLPYVVPISLSSPPSFSDPYQGRTDPFPTDTSNPIFVYPTQNYTVDRNFINGRITKYNFNVQHQFGSDLLAQIGYFGGVGRHLEDTHEGNPAIYGPGATAANTQSRRPFFPQYYGSMAWITSDASSSYNSLQAMVSKKFSHGYTVQLAYTYSKSMDNRSGFNGGVPSGANPHNYLKGEWGLSDFNQNHILALNGIWHLPFLRDRGLLTTAFGGWQLAGMMRVGSGFPFSVTSGQDYALQGGGRGTASERPNLIGNPTFASGRATTAMLAEYFNTTAFAAPQLGQYGNAGRNILIGPRFMQTDLAIEKKFKIPRENWGGFEFRTEMFNLFNNTNFYTPNSTFGSPSFGRITGAHDARIIQFALRYDF